MYFFFIKKKKNLKYISAIIKYAVLSFFIFFTFSDTIKQGLLIFF